MCYLQFQSFSLEIQDSVSPEDRYVIGDILQCPLSTDITLKLAGIYRNRSIVYKKINTNEWYWKEENMCTRKLLLDKKIRLLSHH